MQLSSMCSPSYVPQHFFCLFLNLTYFAATGIDKKKGETKGRHHQKIFFFCNTVVHKIKPKR